METVIVGEFYILITGSWAATIRTIKCANGKLLSDPEEVKSRWKYYFEALYNYSNPVDKSILSEISSENPTERDFWQHRA